MNGWIKLHKKILEWEWFKNDGVFKMFVFLLLSASFEAKKWKGITVKKGQLISSLPSLSKSLGISIQQARNRQNILKSTGEITVKITNKYRIITILKYNDYQKPTVKPTVKQQSNQQHLKKLRKKEYICSPDGSQNKPMKYNYSYSWNEEKKTADPQKAVIDNIIAEFNKQYDKEIGKKMYPENIPLTRKSVKNALKAYTEKEILEYIPSFFSNEFYRTTGWAIWTMMSSKVLNSLKNG